MVQHISLTATPSIGDLNNASAMRKTSALPVDPEYAYRNLAILIEDDDPKLRSKYRPFLLDATITKDDWISEVELSTVTKMAEDDLTRTGERIKVLVLTGSLRKR
jgi:arsenical resistance protein ArsH